MTLKEIRYKLGEFLTKEDYASKIFQQAEYYRKKAISVDDNSDYIDLFLAFAYTAFMEERTNDVICSALVLYVRDGKRILDFSYEESINIAAAMAQYCTEKRDYGTCAHMMYLMYRDGTKGYIKQSKDASIKWLKWSSDLGCMWSQAKLAYIYYTETSNHKEAERLWTAAAEQGDVGSMRNLGYYYEKYAFLSAGAGDWFAKAAIYGDKEAEEHLIKYYDYDEKSQSWFRQL